MTCASRMAVKFYRATTAPRKEVTMRPQLKKETIRRTTFKKEEYSSELSELGDHLVFGGVFRDVESCDPVFLEPSSSKNMVMLSYQKISD